MHNRFKQGRDKLTSRREKVRKLRNMYVNELKTAHSTLKSESIPPEIISELKASIRQQIKKEKQRELIIFFLIIFLFALIVTILLL